MATATEIQQAVQAEFLSEEREVCFHVRHTLDHSRYVITRGKYNFAYCDSQGAVIQTFVPATDSVEHILKAMPHGPYWYADDDAALHVSRDAEAYEAAQ
jgi:hypothetical protein